MSNTEQVTVLTITHKHGTNVSAHCTADGAQAALLAYVTEWWPQERSEPLPDDDGEAIEVYFGNDEWYTLDTVAVEA